MKTCLNTIVQANKICCSHSCKQSTRNFANKHFKSKKVSQHNKTAKLAPVKIPL